MIPNSIVLLNSVRRFASGFASVAISLLKSLRVYRRALSSEMGRQRPRSRSNNLRDAAGVDFNGGMMEVSDLRWSHDTIYDHFSDERPLERMVLDLIINAKASQ